MVVRRNAAFIAEKKGGPGPIEAIGEGRRGQGSVEGFRCRAAGERDEESTVLADGLVAHFQYEFSCCFSPGLAVAIDANVGDDRHPTFFERARSWCAVLLDDEPACERRETSSTSESSRSDSCPRARQWRVAHELGA